jgi:putative phosphoribosyl transferase
MDEQVFADRRDAGDALAIRLAHLSDEPVLVLGLPRGGVVVAARVAERLDAPLDVVIVRKIGCPGHRELAMGALAEWGAHSAVVRNEHVIAQARVSDAEARRRVAGWGGAVPDLTATTVVLVDDGLATGATMHAAIEVVRRAGAHRIVVAVPVGAADELRELELNVDFKVDEVICCSTPRPFHAVGLHYRDFGEVDNRTVTRILAEAHERVG